MKINTLVSIVTLVFLGSQSAAVAQERGPAGTVTLARSWRRAVPIRRIRRPRRPHCHARTCACA
jgi:hypothetical protein